MKITNLYFVLILFLMTQNAFAHGEDKYGPHGGFIRMPGAYHTELVPDGKNRVKVYLLDMEWKNPTLENSSVEINYQGEQSSTVLEEQSPTAQCEPKNKEYIECTFTKEVDLQKKGQLIVKSQRKAQKGNEVTYPLPLKLEKIDDGHGGHH